MKRIKKAAKREAKEFQNSISRAFELFEKLRGAKIETSRDHWRGLTHPDQRDLAQFIFFDVASEWEAFCIAVFALELKKLYRVNDNDVVTRMMSNVDGGALQGYSVPDRLIKRPEVLLGKSSPWLTIEHDLGRPVLDYLDHAHTIRNFIAHAGVGKGRDDFHRLLQQLSIPQRHRKGLSAGRLLLDYQDSQRKQWFKALLDNYVTVANHVANQLH